MEEWPETPEACRAGLDHPDPYVRTAAASRLRGPFPAELLPEALAVAISALETEPDADVRLWLMDTVCRLDPECGPSAGTARRLLADPSPDVRQKAVYQLARLQRNRPVPDEDLVADLRRAWASDPDGAVRASAGEFLARVSPRPEMAAAFGAILQSCPDPHGRSMAILGLISLRRLAQPLLPLVEAARFDPDEFVRLTAEWLLAHWRQLDSGDNQPVTVQV